MAINKSIILQADSYKYSQYCQTPPNTEIMYAYVESRGGVFDDTIFFGLQMFLKETLSKPITQADIDEAEPIILAHGEPFYREGWEYILKEHGGYLPVKISAVPEGKLIPVKNVLAVIENTDPKCWWLPSFIETPTLRAIWYPTTVATNSFQIKKLINSYLIKNGDTSNLDFMLQDFGNRGVSSWESSGIGGCSHLVNFKGTDTVTALLFAKEYYDCDMAGFSVKASEHNSHITWGREGELESYRNMIRTGKPGEIISIVSDSYDIYEACKMFGTVLKDEIIASGIRLTVRPDSGLPNEVVVRCLQILDKYFGHTNNSKGSRVLNNNIKVLQGDGINYDIIKSILYCVDMAGYSTDNLVFGMGGALLQAPQRDDQKFAQKCSAVRINGEWKGICKDPITDKGKVSKKGRVTLFQNNDGKYYSGVEDWMTPVLIPVFENGKILKSYTFEEVRKNANESFAV
jgi:nicotinamide phosphoribosyltransferase